MLYIFAGDDSARIAHESRVAIDKEIARGAHLVEMRGGQPSEVYKDAASTQSIFGGLEVFLLDDVLEGADERESFCAAAEAMAASPHLFVVRTGKLDKETNTILKNTGAKLWDLSISEKPKYSGFNIFALADAFGERDKKRAWTLFVGAVEQGIVPEEIHGTIFWMVKNMLMVKLTPDPAKIGLSPFVLSKAVRFARGFSQKELEMIVERMVAMYHDAHRGLCDLTSELECLVLTELSKKTTAR